MGQVEEKTDEKIEDIADPISDIMEKVEDKVEEEVKEATEESKDKKEKDKTKKEDKKDKEKKEKDTKDTEKKKKGKKKPVKKKSPVIVVSALIILAVLLLIGGIFALRKKNASIVGVWEYKLTKDDNSILKDETREFTFREDGTMQADSYVSGLLYFTSTGTYEIKNGNLYCTLDKTGETTEVDYEIKGGKLIFHNKSGHDTIFTKKETE